jgi:hypothetical protein
MATKIQLRRDTAAEWTSTNPVLATGEFGVELDTGRFKIGDGTTAWTDLEYAGEVSEATTADLGVVRLGTIAGVESATPSATKVVTEEILSQYASPTPPPTPPSAAIGVVDTGTRGVNGADLEWVNEEGDILTGFDPSTRSPWKDVHDFTVGSNIFVEIPIFYVKRDTQPAGKTYAGNQRFMISPTPADGYAADPAVFKYADGTWAASVLVGKYRATKDGDEKATSIASSAGGGTGSISFADWKTACEANGADYHMMSYQEHCLLLWLALVEKKTFNIFPESARGSQGAASSYLGVVDFAYGYSTSMQDEWRDGIRINSSDIFEVFDDDGSRNYVNTGVSSVLPGNYNYMTTSLHEGGVFDFFFVTASKGIISNALIPDGSTHGDGPRILYINYSYSTETYGVFNSIRQV